MPAAGRRCRSVRWQERGISVNETTVNPIDPYLFWATFAGTAEDPGYIGLIVLAELVWVSESSYGASRKDVASIIRSILSIRELVVQDAEHVWHALRDFESGRSDFADCMIARAAFAAGCTRTATFDKKSGMDVLDG